METGRMPIRVLAPGRVFRSDEVDATHSPMFTQVEGMVIDKGISLADLKGTLENFLKQIFNEKVKVRFRPAPPCARRPTTRKNCCGAPFRRLWTTKSSYLRNI